MDETNKINFHEFIAELERNQRSYVFFIGNGVPRVFEAKGWNEICDKMLTVCIDKNIFSCNEERVEYMIDQLNIPESYPQILKSCKNGLYNNKCKDIYKDIIINGIKQNGKQYNFYKKLIQLNPKHIVTTNVDECIKDQGGYEYRINEHQYLNDPYGIFYLHGKVSDIDNMVFTKDVYDRIYSDKDFEDFCKYLFGNKLLFIGYGLEEFEILRHLRNIEKDKRVNSMISICGISENREKRIYRQNRNYDLWVNYGLKTFEYPVVENDYSKLIGIVENILSKLEKPEFSSGEEL